MTTETLRQKQSRFTLMLAQLVQWADAHGYALTEGESYRSDEQAEINAMGFTRRKFLADTLRRNGYSVLAAKIENNTGNGIRNSLHSIRLAKDYNGFFASTGKIFTTTKDFEPLGLFWESIGGTWGGRFSDPGHFSLEHEGVK